jgi:hypothetical protein
MMTSIKGLQIGQKLVLTVSGGLVETSIYKAPGVAVTEDSGTELDQWFPELEFLWLRKVSTQFVRIPPGWWSISLVQGEDRGGTLSE